VIPARALVTALDPASDFDQKKAAIVEIATTCWQVGWDAGLAKLLEAADEQPEPLTVANLRALIEGMRPATVRRDEASEPLRSPTFVSTDGREVVEGGSAGG
jgi:hypothetical protein